MAGVVAIGVYVGSGDVAERLSLIEDAIDDVAISLEGQSSNEDAPG